MKNLNKIHLSLDMTPLVDDLTNAMVAADILGRMRVLREASKSGAQVNPMGPLASQTFNDSPTFGELLGSMKVKPTEAINFINSLTSYSKAAAKRLRGQYRQAAFTVARVEQIALLDRVKALLAQALEEGWTRDMFLARMNAAFDAAGITRLNPYHADVVFGQNMSTAYANGRFQQMSDKDVAAALPFWRYSTMEDERVRPNHAALDGFVAKQGDAVWGTIYPPNGFNCRCVVEPLLKSEGEKILGSDADVPGIDRLPAGGYPDPGFNMKPGLALEQMSRGQEL
jgi:SPP1 gp7 family putative phage head morphogenesis protein